MDFLIKKNQKMVCIGDSITDCGRRGELAPLGGGYVKFFRDMLVANFPERKIDIINKGIGGNTILDLKRRWEDDVLYHKPDWLSILIGINDVHRVLSKGSMWEELDPAKFRMYYDELLKETKEKVHCKIVLLEPFYITVSETDEWRALVQKGLADYRRVVSDMSKKYNTLLIKTQDIFNQQLKYRESETFCNEPVHPNQTGHIIIASELFNLLSVK
jgi:lysophospholipase L1-like esterase